MDHREDHSSFPHPAYAQTVLERLFDETRQHFPFALARVNRAHCVMLCETGILTRKQAAAIASALVAVDDAIASEGIDYSPKDEDVFFAVEARLVDKLGVDLAGRLHTGRSRNDMDHTMFRMELLRRIDALLAQAIGLAEAILNKALREKDTIIVAYTHGQPAQPTTLGHYLFGALEVLLRDIERIESARVVVDLSPMGACAITTTGFPIDRERMAQLLGFAAPAGNSYAAIAGVDYLTSTYSALKLLFLHLGRVIQDLQFWTSFEIAQVYVPNGFVQISSIMPQKRNPVAIEHLRVLASMGVGEAETIVSIMHNTPFTDMNDSEGGTQVRGYGAFDTGGRILTLLTHVVQAIEVEPENVSRNIDRSCITITELADELVRTEGVSFRQAHEVAADVTKAVLAQHATLCEAGYGPLQTAFQRKIGRDLSMTSEAFAPAVSPERFVQVRDRKGGPGAAAMAAAAEGYRESISGLRARREECSARKTKGDTELDDAFARLLSEQS